jgi:ketosteroid isomerase-like protein
VSESVVAEDRRAGLNMELEGRDAYMDLIKVVSDLGPVLVGDVVAIRGERLALFRVQWRHPNPRSDAPTVDVLHVHEVDEDGRLSLAIVFDADAPDAAFDELDERYALGEAAESAETVRGLARATRAWNALDLEAFASFQDPDVVFVDHRPLIGGESHGVDALIQRITHLAELIPDVRHRTIAIPMIRPGLALTVMMAEGTNLEGGRVEFEYLQVTRADVQGRPLLSERFEMDQYGDAVARFEELAGADGLPRLKNACTRTWEQLRETFAEKRWDAHRRSVAEGVVMEDRRSGLRNTLAGVDAYMETARIISGLSPELTSDVVAVRGDRLALTRDTYREPTEQEGAFEVEALTLLEVDSDVQLVLFVSFDPEELDAAFAELEQRYVEGEGAAFADAFRPIRTVFEAYNARDWERLRHQLADDAVLEDHRPASFGVLTPDQWLQTIHVQIDLAPDMRFMLRSIPYIIDGAVLWESLARGSTPDGGDVEFAFFNLAQVRDGRIVRYEWFPLTALEAALARVQELAAETSDRVSRL